MNERQLIEEATSIYWARLKRRKQGGMVVHQQPNKKLSTVEIVDGISVVTLKNVRGFVAKVKLTPRVRKWFAVLRVNEDSAEAEQPTRHRSRP